jgi:long-chain acyl-CoA synthetase
MTGQTDDLNITDGIAGWATRQPAQPALVVGDRAIDYAGLEALIGRGAGWLAGQGVAAGYAVAVCIVDPLHHLVAALALARLGVAQFAFPAAGVSHATVATMGKAGCRTLVTDIGGLAIDGVARIGLPADWLAGATPPAPRAERRGDGERICLVTTSSGTTAEPKLIAVTHRQMHYRMTCAGPMGFAADDRLLSLLDLGTFVQRSLVIRALMSGATVHHQPLESVRDIVDYCNRRRITSLFALPYQVSAWLRAASPSEDIRLAHVRNLVLAGSTVTRQEFESAVERLTPNLYVAYGSNELGTASFADPAMRRQFPLAIGRLVPGAEAEVVDASDRPVAVGEVGRLRVRTRGMITRYPGQDGLNRHHFRGGWFHPGDLASRTAEGVLLFHGRADDMMIFNGSNIYPVEIEAMLQRHPAVLEAAAFPWRSAVHQDVPVAAVVLEAPVEEKELVAFCRRQMGIRSPQRIFAVAALPRNAMGKVVKPQLVAAAARAFGWVPDEAAGG